MKQIRRGAYRSDASAENRHSKSSMRITRIQSRSSGPNQPTEILASIARFAQRTADTRCRINDFTNHCYMDTRCG